MSSIVGAITGGGGKGMGFEASRADLINPVTPEQLKEQYANTQTGLAQQQDFLKAVQAQGGLGNQASVFNQLQGVASGEGPNPAQAMLANSTGANVSNQAALMAGQRGAGSNVGMLARQAGQQGAGIQQNAAGQAAALQANQSLNALNQMGGLATNQANQQANAINAYSNAAQAGQQNLLGAVGAYNNAQMGMQSNMNTVNAGMQGNIASQQGNMMSDIMGAAGSAMNLMGGQFGLPADAFSFAQGGMVPKKMADGGAVEDPTSSATTLDESEGATSGPQSNVGRSFLESQNALGAYTPAATAPMQNKSQSGGGIPPELLNIGAKIGSEVSGLSDTIGGWLSSAGNELGTFFGGMGSALGAAGPALAGGATDVLLPAAAEAAPAVMLAAKGGKVPALVSPGETYLDSKEVSKVKQGANPLDVGEKIPGKPKVKGNSYQNDTIPKTLEAGGVVIPNSIMQSKDAAKKAADFVAAVLKKQALKKGK